MPIVPATLPPAWGWVWRSPARPTGRGSTRDSSLFQLVERHLQRIASAVALAVGPPPRAAAAGHRACAAGVPSLPAARPRMRPAVVRRVGAACSSPSPAAAAPSVPRARRNASSSGRSAVRGGARPGRPPPRRPDDPSAAAPFRRRRELLTSWGGPPTRPQASPFAGPSATTPALASAPQVPARCQTEQRTATCLPNPRIRVENRLSFTVSG